jgi:hypothetical protein
MHGAWQVDGFDVAVNGVEAILEQIEGRKSRRPRPLVALLRGFGPERPRW